MYKRQAHAAVDAEAAAVFVEMMADVARGAVAVVGHGLNDYLRRTRSERRRRHR